MSITKALAGRASIALRVTTPRILLTNVATRHFPRAFTTTTPEQRSVTESVKDSLKKADRVVSDKIVGGIDIGASVAHKVKDAGDDVLHGRMPGHHAESTSKRGGPAAEAPELDTTELLEEARNAAREASGEASRAAAKSKEKA